MAATAYLEEARVDALLLLQEEVDVIDDLLLVQLDLRVEDLEELVLERLFGHLAQGFELVRQLLLLVVVQKDHVEDPRDHLLVLHEMLALPELCSDVFHLRLDLALLLEVLGQPILILTGNASLPWMRTACRTAW